MRLIAIMMGGLLFAAVVAEGVFLARTQKQLQEVSEGLRRLQQRSDRDRERGPETRDDDPDQDDGAGRAPAVVPALQALAGAVHQAGGLGQADPTDRSLPLPPVLSSPEARAQLADFVRAHVLQEQKATRQQRVEQFVDREQERHAEWAEHLGLQGTTAQRFGEILAGMADTQRDMMNRAREEPRPIREVRSDLAEEVRKTNTELRSLIGDEAFKKYLKVSDAYSVPAAGRPPGDGTITP